jgi:hypothetical protein
MTQGGPTKDLVVLIPDKNTEAAVLGILRRTESLGIRTITHDRFVHPERDPGCRCQSVSFMRTFASRYSRCLVLFDKEGAGAGDKGREQIEAEIESGLRTSGWGDRACVIVIDPELEAWVWGNSPHVEIALGWQDRPVRLRAWLEAEGLWEPTCAKPARPKEAVERVMLESRKRRSSAVYEQLARRVSLSECTDPAFAKLRTILKEWFGT